MLLNAEAAVVEELKDPLVAGLGVQLFVKREDLVHPVCGGNKWRKLKYNLLEAKTQGKDTLLTFGGAYSNHIAATAAMAQENGFKSIGMIRGEEVLPLNPTLQGAMDRGMALHYVSRTDYREKHSEAYIASLHQRFGDFYLIPEGGSNLLGAKGCTEILEGIAPQFDVVCCPCGTGATLAGIVASMAADQLALGVPVLKGGSFLAPDIERFIEGLGGSAAPWQLLDNYHFGGYARTDQSLIDFIQAFYERNKIKLEPVYSAKLFYAIYDMVLKGLITKGKRVLLVHTGGMQGLAGMEKRLGLTLFPADN